MGTVSSRHQMTRMELTPRSKRANGPTSEDETPAPVAMPLLCQRWGVVSFLHWPYEPAAVRPLVPEPFELDLFGGSAWVGLVPFRMTTRVPGLPAIPLLSTFPETNVRT